MTESRKAYVWMLATVALWGWTFVLVKGALGDMSPLLFNSVRIGFAFLCLAAAYRREWKKLTRRSWIGGASVGLFLAVAFQLQTAGLKLTTPSKSAFLTSITVVLIPVLGALPWLRSPGARPPRLNVWFGALLALAGILLLTAPTGGSAAAGGLLARMVPSNRGDVLTLGCSFAFAMMVILQDRFSRPGSAFPFEPAVPFEQLTMLQIGFGAAFIGISTPFFEAPWYHATWRLGFALLVTAVIATAAAFAIQSWAQHLIRPAHLALILALEPVFAWIASILLLAEGLSGRAAAGAALVLAGVGAAELSRFQKQASSATKASAPSPTERPE